MRIEVPDGYVLTASDYVYMDQAEYTYSTTKQLIAALGEHEGSDRHVKGRPGIPGTIGTLNERVQNLMELGHYRIAARLIEKKVRKAYRIGSEQP